MCNVIVSDDTPMNKAEPIEEYSAREEHEDRWRWRKVSLGGKEYTIDMKAINPYKKVLSHGGEFKIVAFLTHFTYWISPIKEGFPGNQGYTSDKKCDKRRSYHIQVSEMFEYFYLFYAVDLSHLERSVTYARDSH